MLVVDCISDTHCTEGYHFRDPGGDVSLWLLLHAGDFSWQGKQHEYDDFLSWFADTPQHEKVYIAGNHERYMDHVWLDARNRATAARRRDAMRLIEDQATLALYLHAAGIMHEDVVLPQAGPHLTYLKDSSVTFGALTIYGSPYSSPYRNWGFQATPDTWDVLPDADIYLMHESMRGYGDRVPNDDRDAESAYKHVGSPKLLDRLHEKKPALIVSGHIHEDYGVRETPWGGLAVNASIFGAGNRRANYPVRVWLTEDKQIDGYEVLK